MAKQSNCCSGTVQYGPLALTEEEGILIQNHYRCDTCNKLCEVTEI